MKILPFCAVCRKEKDFWFHYEVNKKDLKESGYEYHEFEPVVSVEKLIAWLDARIKDEREIIIGEAGCDESYYANGRLEICEKLKKELVEK